MNTWSVPGTNQDHLKELLDDDYNVIKKHSVLYGDEEAIEATKKVATPEDESSALPDEYLQRLAALSMPKSEKDKLQKILIDATAEQKEAVISQLELRYSEVKEEVVKQDSRKEVVDNFIKRLENLPQKTSTTSAIKRLPAVTGPVTTKRVSTEQVGTYPRTAYPDANDQQLIQAQLASRASKIPVASRFPNEEISNAQLLAYNQELNPSAKGDISLASHLMPEDYNLRGADLRQFPRLSLDATAREAIAKRTESQPMSTKNVSNQLDTVVSQLTPNQLLVMEVVWDHGEASFQEIFLEINPSSTMAKSTDTADGGLTSTTNVRPPLLTRDEIQAVIYELEARDLLDHQLLGSSIQYRATHNRPQQFSHSWKETLATTIRSLETIAKGRQLSDTKQAQLKIYLRMLYLMAQRKDDAVEKVKELPTEEQEFWAELMFGMADYLQETGRSEEQQNKLFLRSIRKAASSLSEASPLDVDNLHFIESVESYGRFKEFPNTQFKPNQEVLLYAEIDNLTATQSSDGEYNTRLLSTYRILDKAGQRIDYREFPEVNDTCSTQRRDFYVPYRLYIPENIRAGEYLLELRVSDVESGQFGQASIPFTVAP